MLLLSGVSPSAGPFGASRRPLLSLLCHLPSPCQLCGIKGADARIRAVDVIFGVCRAATTALVGESRSGKSTVATMILFTYSTGGLVVVVFCVGWLGVMVLALVWMRAGSLWWRKAVGRGG